MVGRSLPGLAVRFLRSEMPDFFGASMAETHGQRSVRKGLEEIQKKPDGAVAREWISQVTRSKSLRLLIVQGQQKV